VMPHDGAEHGREPSGEDFRAAEEVLALLMPALVRSTPEYEEKRRALAEFRAEVGKDRFDLRYSLRPPRSAVEQAELDFMQGRITEDQFRKMLKADAERPIDVEMLDAFRDAYEERLAAYSRMLQAVIAIATDQRDPDAWRRREAEVDEHVAAMEAKLPLWKEQLATVFSFLAELQAERKGEPVRCGDRSAESAYMLAKLVMDQAAAGWRSSKEIAQRSRTDPCSLYATSASHLFYSSHLPGLPRPQELQALMVLEHARARKALQEEARAAKADTSAPANVSIQAEAVKVTTPSVQVVAETATGVGKSKSKGRVKRDVAEGLILQHLVRRPHDTAEEVAAAVGCSVGLVAESPAWRANRRRLEIAEKEGRDPKAVKLDVRAVTEVGGSKRGQMHASREAQEAQDAEIDAREKELFRRIGEYQAKHPDAAPQEVARALGCTAGDVERRQAMLERLLADQAESAEEEDGAEKFGKRKGRPDGENRQRWIRRRV